MVLRNLIALMILSSVGLASPASSQEFDEIIVRNHNLKVTVGGMALAAVINLYLPGAGTVSASPSMPIEIPFRSPTATDGTTYIRRVTGALSVTIPSNCNIGQLLGLSEYTHIYAIDYNGTVELAVRTAPNLDETELHSTSTFALGAGATSRFGLYSTNARTDVPVKYLGRFRSQQNTVGGVWAWNATPSLWTVSPIKYPVITGVNGTSLRIGAGKVTWDAGSSSYVMGASDQGGYFGSVTTNGTGDFTITYPTGLFSDEPFCTFTAWEQNVNPHISSMSSSSMSVQLYKADTNALYDSTVDFICMGQG